MDFSSYITESLLPGNMCGPNGTNFFSSFGEEKNDLQDRVVQSVCLRFASKAHPSGLPNIGLERQIERGPDETDSAFAARLQNAFDLWKWSGTDRGILTAMDSAGVPSNLELLPGSGWPDNWRTPGNCWVISNREWDPADATHWAKFYVVVCSYPIIGVPFSQDYWANMMTPTWRQQIRKWKDAQATCPNVFVVGSDDGWSDIWAPTGYWGDEDEGEWTYELDGMPVVAIDIGEP